MNYIDLFAGAGGLSEGFLKAGFTPIAHIEMDASACKTLETRVAYHYLEQQGKGAVYRDYILGKMSRESLLRHVPVSELQSVICECLSKDTLDPTFERIDRLAKGTEIDLVIGGPPCQVYSLVGRSRMGMDKVREDVRFTLYKEYAEFLTRYKPKVFVFENVQGLLSLDDGKMIEEIRAYLRSCGYHTEVRMLNASEHGVLQHRKRVIIIGRRGTEPFEFPEIELDPTGDLSLKEALFSDLPALSPGGGSAVSHYSTPHVHPYLKEKGIRNGVAFVTQHVTRPHNAQDLAIYRIAIKKWIEAGERLKYPDLPESLKSHKNEGGFLDRFKVVNPDGPSHTIVAHLSKDGHHFIYPDVNNPRSISVREAARIQSFPDDYYFEGGRGAAFKQIGNAVPPVLANKIANAIKKWF